MELRNLEAKFRLADLAKAHPQALEMGFEPRQKLEQTDSFFVTRQGKLKLREQGNQAWLIYYDRRSLAELQLSSYRIVSVVDAEVLRFMLSEAIGVRAVVRKTRELLLRRNIRLHLDRIEGLGEFGELEAVLGPDDSNQAFHDEIKAILEGLDVDDADLIEGSYFELLDGAARAQA